MNSPVPKPKPVRIMYRGWRVRCAACERVNSNRDLTCRVCGRRGIVARVWRKVDEFLTRGHTEASFLCRRCKAHRPKVVCTGCEGPMRATIVDHFAKKWII